MLEVAASGRLTRHRPPAAFSKNSEARRTLSFAPVPEREVGSALPYCRMPRTERGSVPCNADLADDAISGHKERGLWRRLNGSSS